MSETTSKADGYEVYLNEKYTSDKEFGRNEFIGMLNLEDDGVSGVGTLFKRQDLSGFTASLEHYTEKKVYKEGNKKRNK